MALRQGGLSTVNLYIADVTSERLNMQEFLELSCLSCAAQHIFCICNGLVQRRVRLVIMSSNAKVLPGSDEIQR